MKQKNFRYYLMIFITATVAIFLYAIIDAISNGRFDNSILLTMLFAPIVFTVLLFLFDKVFELIFPNKLKEKRDNKDNYEQFLAVINKEVEDQSDFSIEDYRRLRESEKFQKALKQAYRILEVGETEDITYDYLSKKFKKASREYIAMNIVIKEVKKLKENS